MVECSLKAFCTIIWPYPVNTTTPLIRPNFHGPKVVVLKGLHCTSFNLVGRRAWYIIYQITCKKAEVFLIGPDTVTDTIFFLGHVHRISGYFWIRHFFFPDTAFVQTYLVYPEYESATVWICSPKWKFLNTPWIRNRVNAKSGYLFQWRYKIEPSSLPWISKTVPSAILSLLYLMDFSFKSYNVCAVQPSYDYYTLQLCQTAARQFEASFHVGRTNWTAKQVNWAK